MGQGHLPAALIPMAARFARCLALGFVALAWCALPVHAQNEGPNVHDLHTSNLRLQWEERWFAKWAVADAERRATMGNFLESLRSVCEPLDAMPSWGALGVANEVFAGAAPLELLDATPDAVLRLQALALDLRATPGAFVARAADEPKERMTVRVEPLFELSAALPVTARLLWVSPAGEKQLAREEFVESAFFMGAGFDLFVRAPHSAPGMWQLVLELVAESAPTQRSKPVLVPCVTTTETAFAPAKLLVESGYRVLGGLDRFADDWMQDWAAGRPLERPKKGLRAGGLVLGAFDGLWPAPLFAGTRGDAWRDAIDLELYGALPGGTMSFDGAYQPSLDSVHNVLARLPQDGPRVLVLRGNSVLLNQLEVLQQGPQDLDALVIVSSDWRPTAAHPKLPTLVLTPNPACQKALETLQPELVWVQRLERSVFLSELELPALVAAFLDQHVVTESGDDG